jgi:lipopolysaccharide export system permease protein
MRAGGISFMRMMTWVLVLGLFISAGTLWFNETLVPFGNSKAENLIRYAGRDTKPSNAQVLQDWENGQLSRLIIYQRFDAVSETLYGITMLQYNGGKASAIINADSARFVKKRMAWEFRKGYIQTVSTRGPVTRLPFETQVLSFSKRPDEVKMTLRKADEMTYRELQSFLRGMTAEDTNYLKYLVQLHQKLAIPLASFVFILIGAPLGLRPHRGGSALGFGLAIMIVFFYYVIAHFLAAAANGGGVSPILAAWIPNIEGTAFGFFLISKAAR